MRGDAGSDPVTADLDDPADRAGYEFADVLLAGRVRPVDEAARLTLEALRRYPGCLLAVARCRSGRCAVATCTGVRLVASVATGEQAPTAEEFTGFAVLLFVWLTSARPARGRVRAAAP